MKKLLSLFLALALILSLVGCNGTQEFSMGGQGSQQVQQDVDTDQGDALLPDQEEEDDPDPEDATTDPEDTEKEETGSQETEKPESNTTQTQKPESDTTQTQKPESNTTQTQKPESNTTQTQQPEQQPEQKPESEPEPEPEPEPEATPTLDVNGSYTTKEDVALYLHLYGRLPSNFITKSQARTYGWKSGSLEKYAPGKCIGGDVFGNREGLLPSGHSYYECDIDTMGSYSGRGAKRIVYSSDGLIYYTSDHYASFELLYGEP